MKRIKILFGIWLVLMMGVFVIQSCEEPEPPRPDCEINNYGSVTVRNSTGYNVWVDVTWGNITENYEKLLYNGNSYKYTRVHAGSIEIWITFDGSNWSYNYESLSPCEDMIYTWYLSGKKSAGECPFVLILPNGEEVIPTLKEK